MNLLKPYPFVLIAAILLAGSITSEAQADHEVNITKCVRIEGGYIFGNQIFSSVPLAAPGIFLAYTYGMKLSPGVGLGIGSALNLFEMETFVPVYLNMLIFHKTKANTNFFDFQSGYSLAWSQGFGHYESYSYKGGLQLVAGLGRRFKLDDHFYLILKASYSHQLATLKYSTPSADNITRHLTYHMVTLSMGFMLHQ